MRGYGAANPNEADEVREHRVACPDVPVLAGADRAFEFESAAKGVPFDCVVLDDGFQHTQLARDLDLVLVDSTQPPVQPRPCPRAGCVNLPSDCSVRMRG